jgi:hypothetical protein
MLADLLKFFAFTYCEVMGMPDPPLHDPCAVFYVVSAAAFMSSHVRVDIERSPRALALGQTMVDWLNVTKSAPNCVVTTAMDVPLFWSTLLDAITRADAHSPMNSAAEIKVARAALAAMSTWHSAAPGAAVAAATAAAASAAATAAAASPGGGGSR